MTRNRKTLVILAVLLILASTGLVAFSMQPSARDLLVESLGLTELITNGHAIATVTFDAQGENGSGTVEVWGKTEMGPNGEPAFRAEVLEASLGEFTGITAVTDGTTFWLYTPAQNKVLTGTADELAALMADHLAGKEMDMPAHDDQEWDEADMPENAAEAVDKLLTYVTAERNGSFDMNGTRAIALRLIPIPEQMPDEVRAAGGYLNVWLRPQDRAPLGIELAESAAGYGKAVATTLEINQGVDDAMFTFEIPAGAEVIQVADLELPEHEAVSPEDAATAADIDLLTPVVLPDGATLVDTAVMGGVIVQQYSLPAGASFTIAQGKTDASFTPDEGGTAVTVRGVQGLIFASDEVADTVRSLLTWSENGVQFWIGGDLNQEQALAMAESLK